MPGCVRKSDLSTYPRTHAGSSPDTFTNNIPQSRATDGRISDDGMDTGLTVAGAEVFCNGNHIQVLGHGTTKSNSNQGSPNVIVN